MIYTLRILTNSLDDSQVVITLLICPGALVLVSGIDYVYRIIRKSKKK